MLGALVVGNERGEPHPKRRRSVVRLARHVPESTADERALLVEWVAATLQAVADVAAPDTPPLRSLWQVLRGPVLDRVATGPHRPQHIARETQTEPRPKGPGLRLARARTDCGSRGRPADACCRSGSWQRPVALDERVHVGTVGNVLVAPRGGW